jgi:hypothetical protein
MTGEIGALQRQLKEAQENLALIRERMSEFVLSTDIPLQLVKEERRLASRIRWLKRRVVELRPINVLREAAKLILGPVALRQRLLTQASKLPRAAHLDVALLEEVTNDLIRLAREVRILLEAYRIDPNPGQLEALERRAGRMADYLIRIYRLEAGDAPDLERVRAAGVK